ncbi:MAG TPA: CvpA family protein [Terriglobales bacterium]|nr:CvpA family protein [Terriglobales bacterium]
MSIGDWVIVAALVFSVVGAAAQGFFLEAFSLAGVIVGFLLAAWEYSVVAGWLTFINPPYAANIVAFFLIFFAVAIFAGGIGRIASWIMQKVGLRVVDRVLGAAFGLVRGLLIVTVVVMATAAFAPKALWLGNSQLAPYFLVAGRAASWLAPGEVRNKVSEGIEVLRNGKNKVEASKPAGSSTEPEDKRSASGGR